MMRAGVRRSVSLLSGPLSGLLSSVALAAALATPAGAGTFAEPLPVEPLGTIETLPARYPSSWMLLHDLHFPSILDGRGVIVDLTAETRNFKGMFRVAQFGSLLQASTRPEIYVAETMFSRLTTGERTDVVTIYDSATLQPTGEIVLPGGKRGQVVTQKNTLQFTDNERLGLLFNFTPAASVRVLDLINRTVVEEIETPGCSLVYPTGTRGFSMLCANGTLTTFRLDAAGKLAGQSVSKPFHDIDNNAMFLMPATAGGVAHFATFPGKVQPIDFRADTPKILPGWSLVTPEEAKAGWRPSGWQVTTGDDTGRLYVLMQSNGREGSHKEGGTEVWVFDAAKKTRVQRITLANPGLSIEATRGPAPLLAVSSLAGTIDVYGADGKLVRSLAGRLADSPMVLHAAR